MKPRKRYMHATSEGKLNALDFLKIRFKRIY